MTEELPLAEKFDMSLDQIIGLEKQKKHRERRRSRSRSPRARNSPYQRPPRGKRSSSPCKRVYVGNIPWDIDWRDLKDHMKTVGHVERADIFQDGNRSRGCGVVEFASEEGARRAMRELNDTTIRGTDRPIFVREDREGPPASSEFHRERFGDRRDSRRDRDRDRPREDKNGRQLFVDNLPYSIHWQDLKDHFRKYGSVEKADVIIGKDGRSAGRGTVLFTYSSDMKKAMDQANGTDFLGRTIYVKEDRYL